MNHKSLIIRRTRQSDLLAAFRLVMETSNDLRRRRGMSIMKSKKLTQPPPLLVHIFKTDPEGSFVAHDTSGKLVGFTMALIREDEWYLAFLFVNPALQSQGLGRRLLGKAMNYGKRNGCKRWALATFAYNPLAIAVYSKMGMPPQRPLLTMDRKRDESTFFKKLRPALKLTTKQLTDIRLINRLTLLDKRARQLARPEEHFFWMADENYSPLGFYDAKKLVGYAVVNSRGMIAPVVASRPQYLTSILAEAVNWGIAQGHKYQIVFAQGEQAEVIKSLLAAGFRIDETTLLMASEPISDPKLYIPATLAHF